MGFEDFRATEVVMVFGNVGNDGGYWYLGADGKIHHVPGWNPETLKAFETILSASKILKANLKQVNVEHNVVDQINNTFQKKG